MHAQTLHPRRGYNAGVDIAQPLALFLLVALVTYNPIARVPIGVLAAMFMFTADATITEAVLISAAAVTTARVLLALAARRPGRDEKLTDAAREREQGMRQWLNANPQFVRISFLMGALPFVPSRLTFPVLGAIGAPLRWAVLGSLCGSVLTLYVTTWFSAALAVTFAGKDQAAMLLGLTALTLAIFRIIGAIDMQAWQNERKLRMREQRSPFDVRMFGAGTMPGAGDPFGAGASSSLDDDGEVWEAEVIGEEIIGDVDDGDDGGAATVAGELPTPERPDGQ